MKASRNWLTFVNERSNKISRLFHYMSCAISQCPICNHTDYSCTILNSTLLEVPSLNDVNRELMRHRLIQEAVQKLTKFSFKIFICIPLNLVLVIKPNQKRGYLTIDDCFEFTMKPRIINELGYIEQI